MRHFYGFVGLPNHWADDNDFSVNDRFFEDKEYVDYYFDNFFEMDKIFGHEKSAFGTRGLPVGHPNRTSKSFDRYNERFGPAIVRVLKDSELTENIHRIKQIMGLKETIDVPSDSYVMMNIKNFPKYKKEISDILQDKLQSSDGDFVKFKNSVIVGRDSFANTPILSKDLQNLDNKYLNYMISNGSKQFNSMLYSIFSDYYGVERKQKPKSEVVSCNPSDFKIIGPLVAQDEKSLMSYWVSQKGGKVYKIVLPEECAKQLDVKDRTTYVTVEPIENRVHFPKGVPEKLRGKKLGTLIYLAMIRKLGYITSSMGSSAEIKMIYQDLLSNPEYNLMSLLLQQQVMVMDKNIAGDVKKIFNDFVTNKYTDKKSVIISPELKERLGDDFINWYDSLEESPEVDIEQKIKKYEGEDPKGGDTVVDTSTGKIYSFYGEWEYKGKKRFQVGNEKFEKMELPIEDKQRFKVIHRSEK